MGKTRDRLLAELVERYVARATRLAPIRVRAVSGSRASDARRRSREDAASLQAAAGDGVTVLLTERGEMWSSKELARNLRAWFERGSGTTTFALAGESGLRPEDEGWARVRLGLSAMTLPHELARVVLAEQIYRALTLIRNIKYHK